MHLRLDSSAKPLFVICVPSQCTKEWRGLRLEDRGDSQPGGAPAHTSQLPSGGLAGDPPGGALQAPARALRWPARPQPCLGVMGKTGGGQVLDPFARKEKGSVRSYQ